LGVRAGEGVEWTWGWGGDAGWAYVVCFPPLSLPLIFGLSILTGLGI